jgi:hypothetical protein
MIEAMALPWADAKLRRIFHDAYIKLLSVEALSAFTIQEECELQAGVPIPT